MVIIRGTRKFLDRAGAPNEPDTASTTLLGDWFATLLFWRPQLALFVNATTLLPVFMPLAPAATLLDRFPDTLATIFRAHGIADGIIDRELGETAEQHLAKTNNRSVVGVMNEFVHRLARTIRRWEAAVLAYYTTDGLANAKTEAINALMKKIQRIGHGFPEPTQLPAATATALRRRRMARSTRRETTEAYSPQSGVEPVIDG